MPCWNTARFIGTQLEALARQKVDDPWEVIMADNGSSDDSRRIAEAFAAKLPLRIVDASQRRGAAHARNFGVLKAIGDVVVFCDSDDEVGEGFLAAMGRALRQHELVACRFDFARLNHKVPVPERGHTTEVFPYT